MTDEVTIAQTGACEPRSNDDLGSEVIATPAGLTFNACCTWQGWVIDIPWADVLKHAPKAALVDALKLCDDVEDEPYTYRDPVTNEEHQCLLLYVGGI